MGIPSFYKLLKDLSIPQTTLDYLSKISECKPINIYIDLPIILFSGCISENKKNISNTTYDESLVAETAFKILHLNILNAKKKFKINKIICYTDGIRPSMKIYTSTHRKSVSNSKSFNTQKALKYLCDLINSNLTSVELRNLIIGESESECFNRRDVNFPSLILTDDSDVFHISYKYTKQTEYDLVFIGTKYFRSLYDMSNIDFNMPRLAFLVLLMLKGSDFTEKIFTDTMVLALAKIWMTSNVNTKLRVDICDKYKEINKIAHKYKNKEIEIQHQNTSDTFKPIILNKVNCEYVILTDEESCSEVLDDDKSTIIKRIPNIYNYSCVSKIVKLFIEILILLKRKNTHLTFRWNASNNKIRKYYTAIRNNDDNNNKNNISNNSNNTRAILNALTWAVNYSSIGAFYRYYEDTIYYEYAILHRPFNFYASMLKSDHSIMNESVMTLTIFNRKFVY